MSLTLPYSLDSTLDPRRAALGAAGASPLDCDGSPHGVRRAARNRRRAFACFLGAFALAAVVCILQRALMPILGLFDVGNTMNTNEESQLTLHDVLALSGHLQLFAAGATIILMSVGVRRLALTSQALSRLGARNAPAFLAVGACACCGVVAISQRFGLLDGERYYFLQDDAMTSMVFARNWVEGHGLVYQAGERVEGYTNLLWVVVMAIIHLFEPRPALAPLWVLTTSWTLIAMTGALLFDLSRKLQLGSTWSLCVVLLFAFDRNTWTWGVSGLETSAVAAAVTACAWTLARARLRLFALALVGVCLLRSDGFLLAIILGVCALWYERMSRHIVLAVLPAVAAVTLAFAFRWHYYGFLFPNTYYLKMLALSDRLRTGFGGYGIRMLCHYGLFLALAAFALWSTRDRFVRVLCACTFLQAGYALYVGGDIFKHLRFFAPVIPALYVVAAIALRQVVGVGWRPSMLARGLALCAAPGLFPEGQLGKLPDESRFFLGNLSLAQLFKQNLPQGAVTTIYPAGTIPYYAKHVRYIDVFGKNDAHIAHLSHYSGTAIGHNKSDFDYVYNQRKPDVAFVLLSCEVIEQYLNASPAERVELREQYTRNDSPVRLLDIEHPSFRRDYYPNRVHFVGQASVTPLECVFVRSGSTVPTLWSIPPTLERHSVKPQPTLSLAL